MDSAITATSSHHKLHTLDTSYDGDRTDEDTDLDSETRKEMRTDVEEDERADRARTPPPTGPIIELRSREVIFAILIFFLLAVVVGLIVVLGSVKMRQIRISKERENHKPKQPSVSLKGFVVFFHLFLIHLFLFKNFPIFNSFFKACSFR